MKVYLAGLGSRARYLIDKSMKNTVIIRFEIEGFHNYPDAPEEVYFLSHTHRHSFTITAGYLVTDLNREKEIFTMRNEVINYLNDSFGIPCQFGEMSCEMIASEILEFSLNDSMIWCEVWEEKTGGARVDI
jgi:hypothetical protein